MKDELVELQDKLGGVYDLTDIVDCQSVIRMLLTDMKREKARTEDMWQKLQGLADRVLLSDEIEDGLRKMAYEVRNVKGVKRTKQAVVEFLMKMSEFMGEADKMSDDELISACMEVWSNLDMDSKESAVVEELMERFKKVKARKKVKSVVVVG